MMVVVRVEMSAAVKADALVVQTGFEMVALMVSLWVDELVESLDD